ncbi:MAG: ATP-binding cassette domain-containing protein [Gammaproteobacteria bacterium]|nr:ATP-binding cassette domain-containing protein [Gammaproteobacteria bacterium]NIW46561.1 ATP-binding cassette domain-containing protein [Gammaproteobacteria bacterium]NIX57592.1 ATP-binding cassette domain-containing protein [candidate division Zixibacteria bacterium]
MINAARQAQIDEFIQNSPEGYDTWVGEQGFQLSGGERQRLAIARAILKNAPIMIFDEATANLDALTEQKILQTIQQLAGQKTTLIITHRLVGLENADEIIVLSAGSVVERGSHEFLLAKQGHYWHLWKQQTQILSGAPEEMIRAS